MCLGINPYEIELSRCFIWCNENDFRRTKPGKANYTVKFGEFEFSMACWLTMRDFKMFCIVLIYKSKAAIKKKHNNQFASGRPIHYELNWLINAGIMHLIYARKFLHANTEFSESQNCEIRRNWVKNAHTHNRRVETSEKKNCKRLHAMFRFCCCCLPAIVILLMRCSFSWQC